jgi:hypothetical protein
MKPIKRPLTVRLDEDLLRVVRAQVDRHGASLGAVVADAARCTLITDEQESDEATQNAIDRCFNRIIQMDKARREDHELIREMLALHILSFYNHTPPERRAG